MTSEEVSVSAATERVLVELPPISFPAVTSGEEEEMEEEEEEEESALISDFL